MLQARSSIVRLSRSRAARIGAAAGAGVAAAAWAMLGFGVWPLILLATTFTFRALRSRVGWELAISGSVVVALAVPLVTLTISELLHFPTHGSLTLAWVAVTLGSGWATVRAIGRPTLGRGPGAATFVAMNAGGIVWWFVLAWARLFGASGATAWAMQGDAPNYLNKARRIAEGHGVAGSGVARLAQVHLAQSIGTNGADGAAGALAGDIGALALTWAVYIALMSLGFGALAWAIVTRFRGASPGLVLVATIVASLFALSWFVSGIAVEAGFLNAPLAIVVVTATLIAVLGAKQHPTFATGLLLALVILAISTWGPLAAAPAFSAAQVAPQALRRGSARWAMAVAAGGLAAYLVWHRAAILWALRVTLTEPGSMERLPMKMLPITVVVVAVLALVAARRVARSDLTALVAPAVGLVVALLVAVALAGNLWEWPYYPRKCAWLATASLVVPVLALAFGWVGALVTEPRMRRATLGALVGLVALGWTLTYFEQGPHLGDLARSPVVEVVDGSFGDPERELVGDDGLISDDESVQILRRSGLPYLQEWLVDSWVLRLRDPSTHNDRPIRRLAYGLKQDDIPQLCAIPAIVGAHVIVHTSDAGLAAEVAAHCGTIDASFVVDR